MSTAQQIDVIRRKMNTLCILLDVERDRCALKASRLETGQLIEDKGKWEHESLLREMTLYQTNSEIIASMMKNLS